MATKCWFSNNQKGVSYVEIILTVAIIGVVTAIVVANYGDGQQRQKVIYAAQQVAHDIREMQALSLAGKKDDSGSTRPCGYGLQFNTGLSRYVLFREVTCGDKQYSAATNNEQMSNSPVSLPNDIIIQNITGGGFGNVDIFYDTPFAKVYSEGNLMLPIAPVTVTIGKNNFNKDIVIKSNGEISVN